MDAAIELSSDSEATVRAGATARRRAARQALQARRAAKKLATAAAKKLAVERAAAEKQLAKQRVAAREAAAIAIRGTLHYHLEFLVTLATKLLSYSCSCRTKEE